jgi:RNA polymerase sigma-70 factor (ECF subfamily)
MNTEEFNEIFDAYSGRIYNYILRAVGDRTAAEDLTQDVFIKVYNGFDGLRDKRKLSTWIYRIATNVCLDFFKSAPYIKSKNTLPIDEYEYPTSYYRDENKLVSSIEERAVNKEMKKRVRDFINDLPGDYRAVIILHDLQGFKNREIAEILGVSTEAVKTRLHRARRRLKTVLASIYNEYKGIETL